MGLRLSRNLRNRDGSSREARTNCKQPTLLASFTPAGWNQLVGTIVGTLWSFAEALRSQLAEQIFLLLCRLSELLKV
jgi:hypothetical protein